MTDTILSLENIEKSFDGEKILKNISLDIGRGEFITLLGSSGCGKTTTIRIIAGLETPDGGKVVLNGKDITALAPEKRDVNTVFQNYALFPHMNVEKNIGYGLRLKKMSQNEIKNEVKNALSLVQLEGFEKRNPSQLSGGQKQRVAIVRALAMHPEILLFDEVTAALDPEMVREVLDVMLDLAKQGSTMIIVTHEMQFAEAVADRVYFLDKGNIVETGRPKSFFTAPKTERARQFLNIFEFESVKDEKEEYNI